MATNGTILLEDVSVGERVGRCPERQLDPWAFAYHIPRKF